MGEEKDWLLRMIWVPKMTEKSMAEKQALLMLTGLLQAAAEKVMLFIASEVSICQHWRPLHTV